MEEIKEIKQDVKDIRNTLFDNVQQLARYNTLLEVHIKRTEALEERLIPIETHVNFVRTAVMWTIKSGSLIGAALTFLKLFVLH